MLHPFKVRKALAVLLPEFLPLFGCSTEGLCVEIRHCKKCGTETERYATGKCKLCAKASGAARRAANPDYDSAYRAANPEKRKACCAAYRAANPEKKKAGSAAYRAANPEKERARAAAWRAANPEAIRDRHAAYAAANPELCRAKNANRRARKRNATGSHTAADVAILVVLQKGKCACCKTSIKDGYHVDHIYSLSKNGSNDKLNLQLLCPTCNTSKGAKHPVDFMQCRGFLL